MKSPREDWVNLVIVCRKLIDSSLTLMVSLTISKPTILALCQKSDALVYYPIKL